MQPDASEWIQRAQFAGYSAQKRVPTLEDEIEAARRDLFRVIII